MCMRTVCMYAYACVHVTACMTSCRDRKGVLGGLSLSDQLQIGRGFWGDCVCMTSCRDRKGVLGGLCLYDQLQR